MWLRNLGWVILSIAAWSHLFPEETLALIAELKRQLRLRLIRRAGTKRAGELAQSLHHWAKKQNIKSELVSQVLAERYDSIVDRLGNKAADQVLGEPDLTERYD